MRTRFNLAALALCGLLMGGCVAIGNRGEQPASRSNATLGQQLIDLQKARDLGALSPAEFEQQRARLLGTK